jgi:hypothetical protein
VLSAERRPHLLPTISYLLSTAVISSSDETTDAFNYLWTILPVGDAEPGVRGAKHLHPSPTARNQLVHHGGDEEFRFLVLAVSFEKIDEFLL